MIKIDKSVDHHVLPACLLVNSCKLLAKTGRLTHAVVPVLLSLGSTACSQAAVECKGTGQYGQCVGALGVNMAGRKLTAERGKEAMSSMIFKLDFRHKSLYIFICIHTYMDIIICNVM